MTELFTLIAIRRGTEHTKAEKVLRGFPSAVLTKDQLQGALGRAPREVVLRPVPYDGILRRPRSRQGRL
jgi:hypothetical protein